MSKDIWHTADEIPKNHKDVVEKWKNCYDEICYSMWKQRPDEGSFDSHTIGWVYLSDLLALETELERTRKALNVAVDAINEILVLDSGKFCKEPAEMWKIAKSAKDQITTLEQKE